MSCSSTLPDAEKRSVSVDPPAIPQKRQRTQSDSHTLLTPITTSTLLQPHSQLPLNDFSSPTLPQKQQPTTSHAPTTPQMPVNGPSTPALQQFITQLPLPANLPLSTSSPATSIAPTAVEQAPFPPPLTIVTTNGRKRISNGEQKQPPSASSTPSSTSATGSKRSRSAKQLKSKNQIPPSPPPKSPYPNSSTASTPCVPVTATTTRRRKSKNTVNDTTDDSRGTVSGDVPDEEEFYCTCRRPYDPNKFMICCDGCDDWFHGTCVDVSEEAGELVDKYYCPGCSAKGRTSSWKAKCFRNGCSRPALVPVSKYCSQQCGIQVAEELLNQQDERVRKIKGRKERKGSSNEVKRSRKSSGRKEEVAISSEDAGSANRENSRPEKGTEGDNGLRSSSRGGESPSTSEHAIPGVLNGTVRREGSVNEGKIPRQDKETRAIQKETSQERRSESTGEGEHVKGGDKAGIVTGGGRANLNSVLLISQDTPCPSPGSTFQSSPSTRSGSEASPSPSSHCSGVSHSACASPLPPPLTAADRDDHARLRTLEELKNAAREAVFKVRKRVKFLDGAISRARKSRSVGESEESGFFARRVCGFDVRLVWGDGRAEEEVDDSDENFKTANKRTKLDDESADPKIVAGSGDEKVQEGSDNSSFSEDVCMVPVEIGEKGGGRIVCEKHSGWENLKKAELENEMVLQTSALTCLQEEEAQVLARLQRRRNEHSAATSLNGTIEH